jgi:hypothetical protein
MTTFGDQLYHMGGVPVGLGMGLIPPSGTAFFVDPVNGSDSNDGREVNRAVKTLAVAYGLTTANKNDVVYYIAGSSGLTLTAALTWSNSYTHLIGLCAPTMVGQRARIFQLSTLIGASPLITISGSGCIFANLYVFQGVDDATSLVAVSVTGSRNYFYNVHFAGGGHATQAVDGGASLLLNGGAENTFEHCTIGVDTIAAGTGMMALQIDGDAKRNIFNGCNFTMYAGHTGATFVEVVDNAGFDRYILFDRCNFINDATGYTMASAFVIPAGMGSATHRLLLKDCMLVGVSKLDASDRGILYGNMNAVTGADGSGVAVQLVT